MKNYKFIRRLLIIGFIIIVAGFGCERNEIVVTPLGEHLCWVEEYTAFPGPLFPHDSLLIVDSVVFPDKPAGDALIGDDDQIKMKSVLYFGWERLVFQIDIFRDDTVLVNQYEGKLFKIGDTFRFNVGDSIIQDYGYEYLDHDSLFIYDFQWVDSSKPIFFHYPSNHILWKSDFSSKTKGIFVREIIE